MSASLTAHPRRVLLVDDDVELQKLLQGYLAQHQFEMVGTSQLNTTAITDDFGNAIGCTPVIARGITLNGTSGVDVRGCNRINTDTSRIFVVELVQ